MEYLREMAESGYHADNIGHFHQFMVPWLLRSNGVSPADMVVDIGAGQGHCLIPLARNGWIRLVAVDIEDYNFARLAGDFRVKTIPCDIGAQELRIDSNTVGAVLAFHLIEHLQRPDNLMAEAHRILRPGGKFFLVTPDWRKQYLTFWRDPTHLRPYDKESVARLFRIYRFSVRVLSWGCRFGFGRIKAYRWLPRLGMIGVDLLAIGTKVTGQSGRQEARAGQGPPEGDGLKVARSG